MEPATHLYIVGAGFSYNAGLPLATGFTEALLAPPTPLKPNHANTILNAAIRRFVNDAFGAGGRVAPRNWPPLEDLFTTIDLAANTGHHLGPRYSASLLRTIRRALIVRFMRMLRIAYNERARRPDENWRNLERFMAGIDVTESAFLSLNWDTVIESGLSRTQGLHNIDYACGAFAAEFTTGGGIKRRLFKPSVPTLRLLKPHGSVNWMYCDCCSRMYWFEPRETARIASRLFKGSDSEAVYGLIRRRATAVKTRALCPVCTAETLGTRFATFSYRKALDFPMHLATWKEAENQLRRADNWIFIGYSLPPADYEFKFLLKRVQLSRPKPPRITVITSGGAKSETAKNYKKFFGTKMIPTADLFVDGLDATALSHLESLGALST
ncbi:MAG TPA: hypothetical protein VEX38_07375 [Fimbriimonadaceae bacterium]|nr:hypothetical protein [Fimbriimonadaceae bacterium]